MKFSFFISFFIHSIILILCTISVSNDTPILKQEDLETIKVYSLPFDKINKINDLKILKDDFLIDQESNAVPIIKEKTYSENTSSIKSEIDVAVEEKTYTSEDNKNDINSINSNLKNILKKQVEKREHDRKNKELMAKKKIINDDVNFIKETIAKKKKRDEINKSMMEVGENLKDKLASQKKKMIDAENERKRIENEERMYQLERQKELENKKIEYALKIREKILSNWKKDFGEIGWSCEILVNQNRSGIIESFSYGDFCKNNHLFRESIKNAVYKSEPFPLSEKPEIFEKKLKFTFVVE